MKEEEEEECRRSSSGWWVAERVKRAPHSPSDALLKVKVFLPSSGTIDSRGRTKRQSGVRERERDGGRCRGIERKRKRENYDK